MAVTFIYLGKDNVFENGQPSIDMGINYTNIWNIFDIYLLSVTHQMIRT